MVNVNVQTPTAIYSKDGKLLLEWERMEHIDPSDRWKVTPESLFYFFVHPLKEDVLNSSDLEHFFKKGIFPLKCRDGVLSSMEIEEELSRREANKKDFEGVLSNNLQDHLEEDEFQSVADNLYQLFLKKFYSERIASVIKNSFFHVLDDEAMMKKYCIQSKEGNEHTWSDQATSTTTKKPYLVVGDVSFGTHENLCVTNGHNHKTYKDSSEAIINSDFACVLLETISWFRGDCDIDYSVIVFKRK